MCKSCGTKSNLVMSGVDAFALQVQTETICYDCACSAQESKEQEKGEL